MSKLTYSNVTQIPIADIVTNNNYRVTINKVKIEELASTIGKAGLIQPITVKKLKGNKHKLIVGERRYLATTHLGKTHIEARIVTGSEQAIAELQLIENIQREDVHPLEEGSRFKDMLQNLDAENIARNIGVSEQYVYDRVHLSKLHPEIKDLFAEGHVSLSHCLQFVKIVPEQQLEALEQIRFNVHHTDGDENKHRYNYKPARELKRIIDKHYNISLSKAAFDTTDKNLIKNCGACVVCPKRSGYNKTLFNDVLEEDICFDSECFAAKEAKHLERIEKALKKEGKEVTRITTELLAYKGECVPMKELNVVPESKYDEVESNKYALIVDSSDRSKVGKVVKIYEEQPTHTESTKPVINTKAIQAKNLEQIKRTNALRSYKNEVTAEIGLQLGSYIFKQLPVSVMKLCAYNSFINLDMDTIEKVAGYFSWDISNRTGSKLAYDWFMLNTKNYGEEKWQELVTIINVFITVEACEVHDTEFGYVEQLLEELGVSISTIKEKVECEFQIKLSTGE